MTESPPLLDFDPAFCRRVAKWGAAICLTWLSIAVCVLALVDPTGGACPGWIIPSKNGQGTSLWALVGLFTAFPALWLCFILVRWPGFTRIVRESGQANYKRFLETKGWDDPSKAASVIFPFDLVFVAIIAGLCLFCSIPIWTMILPCLPIGR
ncbi:hypothetical protein [uncultured Bradyrhizobium sp.]|uniref:hypothetical protein n=1 Tax=uncultured Bradyrhizobium sp. TaxID=199684 RepID=UPI002606722F|nr:hypothetical protein [uncultured Bradyrhizobium sp.]